MFWSYKAYTNLGFQRVKEINGLLLLQINHVNETSSNTQ